MNLCKILVRTSAFLLILHWVAYLVIRGKNPDLAERVAPYTFAVAVSVVALPIALSISYVAINSLWKLINSGRPKD